MVMITPNRVIATIAIKTTKAATVPNTAELVSVNVSIDKFRLKN